MGKGQITLFIIIGLIIIIGAAIFLYLTREAELAPIQREISVPEGGQEVYDYVKGCLEQTGREGLFILGQQGGYINIPPIIERNPNSFLPEDPAGIIKVPFWYYEGEDRTPQMEFMERELANYIKENIGECINNFEAFANKASIIPKDKMIPIVSITDNQVLTTLSWPLEITTANRIVKLDEFLADHPVRLKLLYNSAAKLMEYENSQAWFENLTIDLMSANENIPVSGLEFECGTKKWFLPSIKKELQSTLHYVMPYVRVKGTQTPAPLASEREYAKLQEQAKKIRQSLEAGKEPDWPESAPEDIFEVNRMSIDAGLDSDIKAAFVYETRYPMLLNAQPSQGGVLSTAKLRGPSKYLRYLCLNQYHFAYDVLYPVKTILKDPKAYKGQGYTFQMAFPVIIEDNEDRRAYFGLRRFIAPQETRDFCTNFGDKKVDIRVLGFVEDSPVAEELEGANITYSCLSQVCNLGQTYSDGSGAIRLNTYLPEGCTNPFIEVSKEGYISKRVQLLEDTAEVTLTKLKPMTYSIQVYPYYEEVSKTNPLSADNEQWLEGQEYTKFSKNTHATIAVSLRGEPYDQFLIYPPAQDLTLEETADKINFVLGDAQYDIDIILYKGDTPVGGYHAENMTITTDEVLGADHAILKAVEYRPLPAEDFQKAGMFTFLYERGKKDDKPYWTALKPAFV
ncbi:hypothetical protein D6825_03080 [Candidatus Woesearchaeota archaeon]|nr:MAG: hypothetical protein D6825_03080 [Candidatus Woesearchaeota archaeon]